MNLFKRCECIDWKCPHYWYYQFRHEFKRYERSTKTANRQQAQRIADRRRINVLDGKPDVSPSSARTLQSLIDDYLKVTEKEHRTHEKTARILTAFAGHLGRATALGAVSPFAIERWKIARAKEVSQSTVNRELTTIRGLFSRAVTWGMLHTNPLSKVDNYDIDDVRIRVLSDAELARVRELPGLAGCLCRATLVSLARISELLALRPEHIGPTWLERRVKGGSVIRVPISETLRTELSEICNVFRTKNLTQQAATNVVIRALRDIGIEGASHHTMRHTGITIMLEAGINPRVIQKLAGWSSLRMLERYGHVRDAETHRALDAAATALATAAR